MKQIYFKKSIYWLALFSDLFLLCLDYWILKNGDFANNSRIKWINTKSIVEGCISSFTVLARPTHLECVMKGGSIEEDDDDVTTTQSSAMGEAEQLSSFTPAYTYYDWRGNYPKPEELPYPITGMKLLMLDN